MLALAFPCFPKLPPREYWMNYRRPGFLDVWFGSSPIPSVLTPSAPVSKLSLFLPLLICRRSSLLTGEGKGWARSQIILQRESLALYKSFNILLTLACEAAPAGVSGTKLGGWFSSSSAPSNRDSERSLQLDSESSSCNASSAALWGGKTKIKNNSGREQEVKVQTAEQPDEQAYWATSKAKTKEPSTSRTKMFPERPYLGHGRLLHM